MNLELFPGVGDGGDGDELDRLLAGLDQRIDEEFMREVDLALERMQAGELTRVPLPDVA
jgi:hypothetical protein